MNMTKKGYIFTSETEVERGIKASSLAEATGKLPDSFKWDDYYVEELYHIAKLGDNGKWEIIESFWDYDNADAKLDSVCDKYPSAYVEITYNGVPVG
jgi:hypothetical protein